MLSLWIALGSALGGVARFLVSSLVAERYRTAFPFGTVLVNLTGCFAIGLFAGLTGPGHRWPLSPTTRQFFIIGICGGYTTFSSFSLQTLDLAHRGEWVGAGLNVFASVAGCLCAVWLGSQAAVLLGARH